MFKEEIGKKIVFIILLFFVGCFVGWIYEEVFYYFTEGTLANRGVLYGPWLPIYGTGTIFIYLLKLLKNHPIIIFLLVMLLTGLLEYLVGIYLLKISGIRLWDYRGLFLNVEGLVCFRSTVTFAVGGIFLIYFLEPWLMEKINKISCQHIQLFCIGLLLLFIFDIVISTMYRTPITY